MTQQELVHRAGGTTREVREIERGNRELTVSRLCELGDALVLPSSFFLDELQTNQDAGEPVPTDAAPAARATGSSAAGAELIALVREFERIPDPQARKRVLDLVRALADAMTGPR
jgi:transcriptional regulator with XRE-family HTH domain